VREQATLAGKTVLVNLSGRGDKDVAQMMDVLADQL
jgi:tryptophan synthase beta chain